MNIKTPVIVSAFILIGIALLPHTKPLSPQPRQTAQATATPRHQSIKAPADTTGTATASSAAAIQTTALASTAPSTSPKSNDEQTVITTKDPGAVTSYAKTHNLPVGFVGTLGDGSVVVINAKPTSDEVSALTQDVPGLKTAPNYRYAPAVTATDPYFSQQWSLTKIEAPYAWDMTTGSPNVTIAVIDSGILFSQTINGTTYTQPDFPTSRLKTNAAEQGTTQSGDTCWTGTPASKSSNNCDDDGNGYIDDWRGWDFMGGFRGVTDACPNHSDPTDYQDPSDSTFLLEDNDPQPYSCDSPSSPSLLNKTHYNGTCTIFVSACDVGHGTEVASVIAAEANNGNLVAGIDQQAKLMNLRVFDGYGYTDSARIAAAIDYARLNGANIINMSLGFNPCTPGFSDATVEAALTSAKNAGLTIAVSSGNANTSNVCYPGSSPNVIGVGATDNNDKRASFSSYGSELSVVAPGVGIITANAPTTYANSNLVTVSGTSFSAPHVAGLAGLIKAIKPSATPDEIKSLILYRSNITADMGTQPRTNEYGYGRINAPVSVRTASGQLPIYRLTNPNTLEQILTTDVALRNNLMSSNKILLSEILRWSPDGSPVLPLTDVRAQGH